MTALTSLGIAIVLLSASISGFAQSTALTRLQRYIEVDTTNPPGNESRGVAFFSSIFDEAGIAYDSVESAPGRGNIWARLKGGDQGALILLHHMDVVPATAQAWDSDPMKAVVRDGQLWGRGTLDTKSLGIMHLEAFLALHRSGVPLKRDVVFLATADEEAGGLFGAGWLVKHRPEIFAGAGFLLNEGGAGIEASGETRFQIEIAQKRPFWLRLIASDEPGHGAAPHLTSAPSRLVAALHRIHQQPFEPRITPPVREMFRAISAYEAPDWRSPLQHIDESIRDADFLHRIASDKPHLNALLRNTCSITTLVASNKINVVPPTASAELDCRILPDQDADEFLAAVTARVDDDHIRIEQIMRFEASESSADTALFRLLQSVSQAHYPDAGVVASVAGGFTDSHFFRERGIVAYGYAPIVIPAEALGSVHGNNERIRLDSFSRGVDMMTEIVASFASAEAVLPSVAAHDCSPVQAVAAPVPALPAAIAHRGSACNQRYAVWSNSTILGRTYGR